MVTKKLFAVRVPVKLLRRLKLAAVKRDRSIEALVEEAFRDLLRKVR